jgi:drug/metabolite transporter (DMT)-like permease
LPVVTSGISARETVLRKALPWLSLVTVWFVWGSTYLGIRVAVESMPPFLMTGVRYLMAGSLLYLAFLLTGGRDKPRVSIAQFKRLALSALLLLVVGNGLLCWAEQRVPSGTAALVVATTPAWMLVVDAMLSRRWIATRSLVGLLLGMAGVVLLVGSASGALSPFETGVLLFSSLSWATGSVLMRRHASGETSILFPALEMLLGGFGLLLAALASGELLHVNPALITRASLEGFLWLVFGGALLGYTAYTFAVRTLPTRVAATYGYVNPIVAVILGAMVLHEALTPNILVGGAAIVVSVAVIMSGDG